MEQNNPVIPKSNNFLITLLSILLLISCIIAGFFAYQTQQLVKELRVTRDELKQTPTSTVTPDPTTDWKTFSNTQFGFSFKYPENIFETSLKEFSTWKPRDPSTPSAGGLSFESEIENITLGVSILETKATINEFMAQNKWCFKKEDCKYKDIPIIENSIQYEEIFPVSGLRTFVKRNGYIYDIIFNIHDSYQKITNEQIILYDQVLSTFKFIEQQTSSSPVACTMEAKLCPDGSGVGRIGPNCEFTPCPN